MKPPIVIIAPDDAAPEYAFVIRRLSTNEYAIDESGDGIVVTEQGLLAVKAQFENSVDGAQASPTGIISTAIYQHKNNAGDWIVFSVQDGQLVATYA